MVHLLHRLYGVDAPATIRFVRLANALLKDEESARDNHVLTCNFTKYSPIKKNCCHRQTEQ